MKKKKTAVKFSLKKITISNLDRFNLDEIRGGTDCPPPTTSIYTGDPCYDECAKPLDMTVKAETRTCMPSGGMD